LFILTENDVLHICRFWYNLAKSKTFNRGFWMKKQWHIVEVLRQSRHDWLNKIQLIKGNLALNKLDRVKEIIEEIVIETQQEAKLTNLNALEFAELLMTYNWQAQHFQLEYEVLGDVCDLSAYDEELANWCRQFFYVLEEHADGNGENHLSISIEIEENVRFFFDYSGTITNASSVKEWISSHMAGTAVFVETFEVHNDEMTVVLKVIM
jgi:stage 0 sporulation protein B (sporulation initiation phosphotransferase)